MPYSINRKNTELIVDFGKTSYISSAGLRTILLARKTMIGQGSMKVIHVSREIMDIFELTGFSGLVGLE